MTERINDERAVKRAKDRAQLILDRQADDLRTLIELPAFRRYLWRLIGERCQILTDPGSNNGSVQSTNIGRQNVGRELWAEIEQLDPLLIPQMMTEHFESLK